MKIKHIRIDVQPSFLEDGCREVHTTVRVGGQRVSHIVVTIPPYDFESFFDLIMARTMAELKQHFRETGDAEECK